MLRLRLLSVLLLCALVVPALGSAAARRHPDDVDEGVLVARYARTFVGIPYRWGGTSPRTGFDCSGFVAFVYRHFGVALPHYTVAQFDRGRRVARGALRPGDLVFFAGLSHVGLYIGGGRFVHAPHTGTRVSVASLRRGWYGTAFAGARRILLG
jgi:peptidoglycan DL-endopeptidase CwlO